MAQVQIHRFPDARTLAAEVARQWLDHWSAAPSDVPWNVALSGGRISQELFKQAAAQVRERKLALDHLHFFWADERCVAPTHPESNFGIADQLLFKPLAIPENQIHRIRGEVDPDRASIEAAAEMTRLVPKNSSGQPQLDLVFLGMGEDGHIASLFPHEPEAMVGSKSIYRPVIASKPPPHRITINYGTIAAARQIWVVISGAGKEQALAESLQPNGQTPLARLLRIAPQTVLFTDLRTGEPHASAQV